MQATRRQLLFSTIKHVSHVNSWDILHRLLHTLCEEGFIVKVKERLLIPWRRDNIDGRKHDNCDVRQKRP